jgi:hypothetical protein
MKIINIIGGLGNQLFQYALYYWLNEKNHLVKIDNSYFDTSHLHNGYELEYAFKISPNLASREEVDIFTHGFSRSNNPYIAIKKVVFNKTDWQLLSDRTVKWEYKKTRKNQKLFELYNAYLIGYWSKENYLLDIQHELRNHLKFKCEETLSNYNLAVLNHLQKDNNVALHIRGGDFANASRLGSSYYLNSLKKLADDPTKLNIIVFTNDENYTKQILDGLNYKIIDNNYGVNSNIDMFLMSKAKNLIIANSTFSWWAAYLNDSAKNIICPKRVFDVRPLSWIEI